MYKLNKEEENLLKFIIKCARKKYFKSNNTYFYTEHIDDIEVNSNVDLENEVIYKYETNLHINQIENFFTEEKIFKVAKNLSYSEKLLLFLFYVEGKSDKEIAEILSTTWKAVKSKRTRTIKKMREKLR